MKLTPLVITVCATKSYCYAMFAQSRRIQAAIANEPAGVIVLVGDESPEFTEAVTAYQGVIPDGWTVEFCRLKDISESANYQAAAQLLIARMRTAAFTRARQLRAQLTWSLDSDVLPPANAIECMRQMLAFDGGYYSISTCPYPSQGGTLFLGGRGTPQNPILSDVYPDERNLPDDLAHRMGVHQCAEIRDEAWWKEGAEIHKAVTECQPKGNVFKLNAKGWRRRGWLDFAYPGIGRGAVVPTDWCGFGCTLMNPQALQLAQFDGYEGAGTEDLYIVWKRWHQAGLRLNVITHCPCDHVSRDRENPGRYFLQQTRHELEGETVGHLRVERRAWFDGGPLQLTPPPLA
jgi:hypothetical protein